MLIGDFPHDCDVQPKGELFYRDERHEGDDCDGKRDGDDVATFFAMTACSNQNSLGGERSEAAAA